MIELRLKFLRLFFFVAPAIIQSDRIIVMDRGRVGEFDSPAKLLEDPNSLFSKLIDEAGPEASKRLRELAMQEPALVSTQKVKGPCLGKVKLEHIEKCLVDAKDAIRNVDADDWRKMVEECQLSTDNWKTKLRILVDELARLSERHLVTSAPTANRMSHANLMDLPNSLNH